MAACGIKLSARQFTVYIIEIGRLKIRNEAKLTCAMRVAILSFLSRMATRALAAAKMTSLGELQVLH
jgi:hypothetical protein